VTQVDETPAPAAAAPETAQPRAVAWFVEPRDRTRVLVLFMLTHMVIPTVSSIIVRSIVTSGRSPANLGLLFLVNSLIWGAALSGMQAFVLRRYVPAAAWFGLTAASIVAVGILDFMLGQLLVGTIGVDAQLYYGIVMPILRWLVISSSQWLVLQPRVKSAALWIAASVFSVALYVVLQRALITAGQGNVLIFPWGGFTIGAAQCWCLLQFTRRDGTRPAEAAPV
jgi:hypothetical protein